jgi:hypothetical protein
MIVDQLFTRPAVVGNTRQFFNESRHNKLLKEDVTYRNFHNLSRMLAERKMSEKEILDLFAAVEAGANATGQNRTALGRGKDAVTGAYTSAKDAIGGVLNSIAKSTPVAGVDAAYNDATGALRNAVGANSKVMDSIKKYRLLAKEYPKTQLFVKTALIALAGMATGGAGLPAIAGLTAAIDSAIRGEKLSSIIGKGSGAALMGLGAQQLQAALSTPATDVPADQNVVPADQSIVPGEEIVGPDNGPSRFDEIVNNAIDYKVKQGDTLSEILADRKINPEAFRRLPGNDVFFSPDGNPNILKAGQTIKLPDPADVVDLNKMSGTTPSDPSLAKDFGDTNFYTGQYNQNSAYGLDAKNNLQQQGFGRFGSDGGIAADRVAQDAARNTVVPEPLGGSEASSTAPATVPSGPMLSFPDGGNAGTLTLPDGRQVEAYAFPQGGIQPRLGPDLERVSVNYAGQDVTAYIKGNKAYIKNFNPAEFSNPVQESWVPAVKLLKLPAEQLIDQKLTVMAWALNESTGRAPIRNIHLTHKGVLTVIENVDRHRRSLLRELDAMGPGRANIPAVPRQDMPLAPQAGAVQPGTIGRGLNWLDKATGKVGSYLSKQAQNFTRKVTAAKLKTEWEQEGHQTDSDYIAAFLAKQGVPQGVITDVYGKMGIPYTAPAVQPTSVQPQQQGAGIQTGEINAIDPDTGKPYEKEKLARMYGSGATTAQTPAPAPAPSPAPAPAPVPSKITQPNTTPSFNATNVMQMPGMEKYAKTTPAAPAKTANFGGGPAGYGKTTTTFKAPAAPAAPAAPKAPKVTSGGPTPNEQAKLQARLAAAAKAQPVAETIKQVKKMLETVQTKDDVAFIKKYISRQFSGQLSESANAQRSHLLSEVTRIGAQRRRQYSQQLAK